MRAAADRRLASAKAQWVPAAATVLATPLRGIREGLPAHADVKPHSRLASFHPTHLIGNAMNRKPLKRLLIALVLGSTLGLAQAQSMDASTSPSRSQVKMETKEFLRTHRWEELSDTWLLKSGVEPPTGVMSRATVRAQRDEFLRLNRWDEPSGAWIARKPAPPTISSLTREEVRVETIAFVRTHHWDEEVEGWVAYRSARAR